MGSIVGSVSVYPKRVVLLDGSYFRNATGYSEGTSASNIASAQSAVDAAHGALKSAERLLTERQADLDAFINANVNTVSDYNKTYPIYKSWQGQGEPTASSEIQNLIQYIVVNKGWQKGTWGNANVQGTVNKKNNSYDRVYLPPSNKNRYWFQIDVVRNFVVDIYAKYNNYVAELENKKKLVDEQKKQVDLALARYKEAQDIKNKTAIEIANAENAPEIAAINAKSNERLTQIKTDAELDKADTDLILKTTTSSQRNTLYMVLGGIGLLAVISLVVVLKK